jgi:DnaJ-class molecular chaperone
VAEIDPKILDQFESLFGDLFGASRTRTKDLTVPLRITLLESAHGGAREVELPRSASCEPCRGHGGAVGATYQPCGACGGKGGEQTSHGAFVTSKRCNTCAGKGGRWSEPCPVCRGRGEITRPKSATVQIPPGIEAGSMLRLAGQGNDLGEGPGDAFLLIELEPHPSLRRVGADLRARVHVAPELRANGGEISVPWLTGEARVRVPPGVVDDTEVRLRGWGCVRMGSPYSPPPTDESPYRGSASSPRGDLIVTLTTRPGPDPYEVLGLTKGATPSEIRAAYRSLMVKHHPDRSPDDPDAAAKLAAITEAYVRLSPTESHETPAHDVPRNGAAMNRPAAIVAVLLAVALGLWVLFAR